MNLEDRLNNNRRRTAMGEKTSAEKLGDFLCACNGVTRMKNWFLVAERVDFGIDELAKRKLARKTLFEVVMAVVDFVFAFGVFVLAMRNTHFFF